MRTHSDLTRIALAQSALEFGCDPSDFLASSHKILRSVPREGARAYLPLPFACDLVSYGSCVVAQTSAEIEPIVSEYLDRYPTEHCMETPHIHALDEMLAPHGLKTCFQAAYFLPDPQRLIPRSCPASLRMLEPQDFASCYTPEWSNALCEPRRHLDVLAVGAYDGGRLVGLAGCSADCETMWQIGIDVLPAYRRCGIASALTTRLAIEILARGKVPFYCAAWCNVASVGNAVKSGFRPAWVELTAREIGFVREMNRRA